MNGYFERFEIEEIILGMASIVHENRRLQEENDELREYEQKYHNLIDRNLKEANESSANLFKAIMMGAFKEQERKNG